MNFKIPVIVLVFYLSLVCASSANNGSCHGHKCQKSPCYKSPCYKYTMKEAVGHLWDIPQNVTSNIQEFKDAVNGLVEHADDRLLGYLVSLSLWSIDYFTGMPVSSPVHPSCVYGKLLNQSIVDSLVIDPCVADGLDRARKDYGELCSSGIENTLFVGMKVAGCEIKTPCPKPTTPCSLGSAAQMLLADKASEIPESLKPILSKLLNSSNPDDAAVAAAAFGASTKTSIDLFQEILCEESFIKAVQLKSCKIKIPPKCCSIRQNELIYWIDALKEYTQNIVGARQ